MTSLSELDVYQHTDVREYLESVERLERKQAERFWRNLVPIETSGIRVATVSRQFRTPTMDAASIRRYQAAYMRVRRNMPHCLETFRLIVRNGENRKDSIWQLEMAK